MKDRALIENVFWHGVELKELAQGALDALQEDRREDCKRAIVDILRQVDLLNRRLHFFAGDEGVAQAELLDAQAAAYVSLADAAEHLLHLEKKRQEQCSFRNTVDFQNR